MLDPGQIFHFLCNGQQKWSYKHHDMLQYISPGKTCYHNTTRVKETLAKQNMDLGLNQMSWMRKMNSSQDHPEN